MNSTESRKKSIKLSWKLQFSLPGNLSYFTESRVRLTEEELARISWRKHNSATERNLLEWEFQNVERKNFQLRLILIVMESDYGPNVKFTKRVFEAFQPSPTEIAVRRAISANVLKTQHKARWYCEGMKTSNRWFIQMKCSPAIRYHHDHRNWAQRGSRASFKVQFGNFFCSSSSLRSSFFSHFTFNWF